MNGKKYERSPGQQAHDVDYFHHFDRRLSFADDYNNDHSSPDTQTKVTRYDPVKHMNKLANKDFKNVMLIKPDKQQRYPGGLLSSQIRVKRTSRLEHFEGFEG